MHLGLYQTPWARLEIVAKLHKSYRQERSKHSNEVFREPFQESSRHQEKDHGNKAKSITSQGK